VILLLSILERLANLLEVDDYFYDVLPPDKANIVEKLQQEGKTVGFGWY